MTADISHKAPQAEPCTCYSSPLRSVVQQRYLGIEPRLGEVSLLTCPACGQVWLRYFYENEAFTASGRWYLGALTAQQAAQVNLENAVELLESLPWYFYGGSYYHGRTGKTSGMLGF